MLRGNNSSKGAIPNDKKITSGLKKITSGLFASAVKVTPQLPNITYTLKMIPGIAVLSVFSILQQKAVVIIVRMIEKIKISNCKKNTAIPSIPLMWLIPLEMHIKKAEMTAASNEKTAIHQ